MNDAERVLISVAVSESIAGNTNSEFTYAFGDGENYPDVEAWPVLLRVEGTDQLTFYEEFRFELTPFLQKLKTIVDHPVELKQLQIMYDENGMDIFFRNDADAEIWISILRSPPPDADATGTLTTNGSVIFDNPTPPKN